MNRIKENLTAQTTTIIKGVLKRWKRIRKDYNEN
jgi:hypothetical protein